uniref:Uncharacterized protein n=1 Tax=Arundo donax TaxID=35708 RepID=A0A0A9B914_ARUDO
MFRLFSSLSEFKISISNMETRSNQCNVRFEGTSLDFRQFYQQIYNGHKSQHPENKFLHSYFLKYGYNS